MNDIITLKKIEQSKLAIREVKTLDEIKKIVNQSEALKAYAKSAQMSAEMQADIAELNLRATRRLGQISAVLEKAKPGVKPTELRPRNGHNSKTATLERVGITRQRANEAEMIATIPEERFESIIAEAKETSKRISKSLFKDIEAENKLARDSKAIRRVAEYRKTGIKPKGWIDDAYDELNRLADERDARLDAYFKELAEKKGLEAKYQNDPFPGQFQKYLDSLDSDAHRIVVCNGVMKICRQTLAVIQKKEAG
jgi:hypothetical protein